MSQKDEKWPESHYNLNLLGKWFALASLLLLILIGLIFYQDYNSEWKAYQKQFRKLESKQTRESYNKKKEALEAKGSYKKALQLVKDEKANLKNNRKEHKSLLKQIRKAEEKYDKALSSFQYIKADYDELKYNVEAVSTNHAHGDLPQLQNNFQKIKAKKESLHLQSQRAEVVLQNLQAKEIQLLASLKQAEEALRALSSDVSVLKTKLEKVDFTSMDTMNKLGTVVRDLPVLDMLAPYYKIDQVVVKDIQDDLNFVKVAKVDRCMSCHNGIMKKGFEKAPQPFTTHPNLDLFLSSSSAHPVEEFACTSCHQGRGRGTSFNSTAHMPSSPEQAKAWKEKYHWEPMHHWETPMLPKQHVQSSCLKCHQGETIIKGADQLNLGLKLMGQSGCYACHEIDAFKGYKKVGPSLTRIGDKLSDEDWTYHWIHAPQDVKPGSWMPHYFKQSNNSDSASLKRSEQEVLAMKTFLYKNTESYDMKDMPVLAGDPIKGKELVASSGCYACHQNSNDSTRQRVLTMNGLSREVGPNLTGLAAKTNAKWLYNWLKDPKSYHPGTAMPNMRLSDEEVADITAFLMKETSPKERIVAEIDHNIMDGITLDFKRKVMHDDTAREEISKMTMNEKMLFSGKRLLQYYGCASCHEVKGLESTLPIGPELNGIASKPTHKFDFGFVHLPHTTHDWLFHKVKHPRNFDHGKKLAPLEKLIMPNFNFSDEEAEAIVTVLMGLVKPGSAVKMPKETESSEIIKEGQQLIRQLNCRACHIVEGFGGAVKDRVEDWLVKFEGKSEGEAKAVVGSFSPPNLIGEGKKVHAEWLFKFLHHPTEIRPWLKVRMPKYGLDDRDLNTLVKYFNYLDHQEFPFQVRAENPNPETLKVGQLLSSANYFDCSNCHIQGDKVPAGTPDRWAPNFALAKERLKPEWIVEWLYDPQKLLPGTKMPTYFDPEYFDSSGPDDILDGDEHKHIRALKDYVLHGQS
jgi:cytochrome c2/predicted  nucleic acid-binding Zn-ribbon protein